MKLGIHKGSKLTFAFFWKNSCSRGNRVKRSSLGRKSRCVYNDFTSSFEQLLEKDNSHTVHNKNLQVLATELYKVKNNLSPEFLKSIFERNTNTKITRNNAEFKSRKIHSVFNGSESLSFLGPKIWSSLPESLRNASTLKEFKTKIKERTFKDCPCRICRTYIQDVGFVN